jgi:hypothetical protein
MERVWVSRLRWRVRGAWQWRAFAVLLVVDAVLLHELPIAGSGPDWALALILAATFQLIAVAAVGPLLGLLVRRRRPDLPRIVARDRAGTAVLLAITAGLVGLGFAHRPALRAHDAEMAAQAVAVRTYVLHNAGPVYRRHLSAATTVSLGAGLYRTCVPSARPLRALCLFVDTAQSPPGIRLDPNRGPNSTYLPDPGR